MKQNYYKSTRDIMRHTMHTMAFLMLGSMASAQSIKHYTTTEKSTWGETTERFSSKAEGTVVISIDGSESGIPFVAWGTCFNELDWDAFNLLNRSQQNEIMRNIFSPQGDLKFSRGRLSMNANDYAREWYSCSEVSGDFDLKYFNIEHDKRNIIPLIKAAQAYADHMEFFMSPWSPPAWMKINQDYPVLSNKYNKQDPRKDYLLYATAADKTDNKAVDPDEMKLLGERNGVFPRRLATQDYFIQEPRYLQAYANMFVRFIDLYKEQGIDITTVCYQNEAYSYTPYPGCAWTAEGTIRFNRDYLAPALRRTHPEVRLWLGTFNTNRQDYIEKMLNDTELRSQLHGVATQWECRECLPSLRSKYPDIGHWMCSESECGNGSMDWKAGEHTFFLLSDNLGNGVDEYYIWNFLLQGNGTSTWGWSQNALVQVIPASAQAPATFRYTPEYYAVKHFSQFIGKDDQMVGYAGRNYSDTPVVAYKTAKGYAVTAGNFTDATTTLTVKIGKKYLNLRLQPHSFNTFII